MKTVVIFIATFVLTISFSGCNKGMESGLNGKWNIISLKSGASGISFSGASIEFFTSKNKVEGRSLCNSFTGSYNINGENISFKNVSTTLAACVDQERMLADAALHKLLNEVSKFKIESGKLYLMNGDDFIKCERGN